MSDLQTGPKESTVNAVTSTWRKSSRCESSMCVEVATGPDGAAIRNSADPQTVVQFNPDAWRALIADVKAGRFDAVG